MVLTLKPGGRIRLQVLAADGTPVHGASVEAMRIFGSAGANVTDAPLTDVQGFTELHVP